jgi:chromosome segregation ATPase
MNKAYLIVPVVLLVAFLFTPGGGYFSSMKQLAAKQEAIKAEAAALKAADDKRRAEIEAKANEDAKRRQNEREAEEKAKADKKEKDYADALKKLKDEADGYSTEADKLIKESAQLEDQLVKLRNEKEKVNHETFELAKQVELAKVERRNAELEIQRMIQMVGNKLNTSSLANVPPPPPLK